MSMRRSGCYSPFHRASLSTSRHAADRVVPAAKPLSPVVTRVQPGFAGIEMAYLSLCFVVAVLLFRHRIEVTLKVTRIPALAGPCCYVDEPLRLRRYDTTGLTEPAGY